MCFGRIHFRLCFCVSSVSIHSSADPPSARQFHLKPNQCRPSSFSIMIVSNSLLLYLLLALLFRLFCCCCCYCYCYCDKYLMYILRSVGWGVSAATNQQRTHTHAQKISKQTKSVFWLIHFALLECLAQIMKTYCCCISLFEQGKFQGEMGIFQSRHCWLADSFPRSSVVDSPSF